jgi:aerobic carbon-monoxide dehydrogenase medium subunit
MKPAAFAYHAPDSLPAMLELLGRHGEEGKLLAGGQSLMPMMNFRLARPAHILDLNGVPGLDAVRADAGALHIGALVRHAAFRRPPVPGPAGALLATVCRHIAHEPIRERGTFAGSLAHADPAAEWSVVSLLLDATLHVHSRRGTREIGAGAFFLGPFSTPLAPDELIGTVRLPLLGAGWATGFAEVSRRAGDFAIAMTAVALRLEAGSIREARVAIGGVEGRPSRQGAAEALLCGQRPEAVVFAEAADAVAGAVDPMTDLHADRAFRRDLVRTTTRRALAAAAAPAA